MAGRTPPRRSDPRVRPRPDDAVEPLTARRVRRPCRRAGPRRGRARAWAAPVGAVPRRGLEPDATIDAAELIRPTNPTSPTTPAPRVTTAALGAGRRSRLSLHAAGLADGQAGCWRSWPPRAPGRRRQRARSAAVLGYLSPTRRSRSAPTSTSSPTRSLSRWWSTRPARSASSSCTRTSSGCAAPACLRRLDRWWLRRGADAYGLPAGLRPTALSEAVSLLVPQTSYIFSSPAPVLELTRLVLACRRHLGAPLRRDRRPPRRAARAASTCPADPTDAWQHLPPVLLRRMGPPAAWLARAVERRRRDTTTRSSCSSTRSAIGSTSSPARCGWPLTGARRRRSSSRPPWTSTGPTRTPTGSSATPLDVLVERRRRSSRCP